MAVHIRERASSSADTYDFLAGARPRPIDLVSTHLSPSGAQQAVDRDRLASSRRVRRVVANGSEESRDVPRGSEVCCRPGLHAPNIDCDEAVTDQARLRYPLRK